MLSNGPCQNKAAASKPPLSEAGSLFICLSAGISLPTSSRRHQIPEKFLGEKPKIRKRVAIHLQGLFCFISGKLGESHDSVLAEENLSLAFEVSLAFQRSLAQD